jgi:hypothetical protein
VFNRRWTALQAALETLQESITTIDHRVEKMEVVLMVREPSSSIAADAYDGLRKQVIGAVSERLHHLAQLVQLDSALTHGADREVLHKMLDDWCEQASLLRITEVTEADLGNRLFELVEDGGGALRVVEPAYVDGINNRVIRPGRARRLPRSPSAPTSPPLPAGDDRFGEGR